MLDAASRRLAEDGWEKRCQRVLESLRRDAIHGESTLVLAAAVAAAERKITPAERSVLERFARELGVAETRLDEVLHELTEDEEPPPAG